MSVQHLYTLYTNVNNVFQFTTVDTCLYTVASIALSSDYFLYLGTKKTDFV